MKLISGNANKALADKISSYLDVPLTQATLKRFSDKEIFVEINENVRGSDVFFIQPTSYPANDNMMELLIAIDASLVVITKTGEKVTRRVRKRFS